jgi:hypothetical protein
MKFNEDMGELAALLGGTIVAQEAKQFEIELPDYGGAVIEISEHHDEEGKPHGPSRVRHNMVVWAKARKAASGEMIHNGTSCISISLTKTVSQIAAEIERRFLSGLREGTRQQLEELEEKDRCFFGRHEKLFHFASLFGVTVKETSQHRFCFGRETGSSFSGGLKGAAEVDRVLAIVARAYHESAQKE